MKYCIFFILFIILQNISWAGVDLSKFDESNWSISDPAEGYKNHMKSNGWLAESYLLSKDCLLYTSDAADD